MYAPFIEFFCIINANAAKINQEYYSIAVVEKRKKIAAFVKTAILFCGWGNLFFAHRVSNSLTPLVLALRRKTGRGKRVTGALAVRGFKFLIIQKKKRHKASLSFGADDDNGSPAKGW